MIKKRLFSVIEIIAVIAVILILSTIFFTQFIQGSESSKLTACQANLKNISNLLQNHVNKTNTLPGMKIERSNPRLAKTDRKIQGLGVLVTPKNPGQFLYCPSNEKNTHYFGAPPEVADNSVGSFQPNPEDNPTRIVKIDYYYRPKPGYLSRGETLPKHARPIQLAKIKLKTEANVSIVSDAFAGKYKNFHKGKYNFLKLDHSIDTFYDKDEVIRHAKKLKNTINWDANETTFMIFDGTAKLSDL